VRATDEQLVAVAPYANYSGVETAQDIRAVAERTGGEVDIYCPMHADSRRSAQLNPEKGVWYCHAEGRGSSIRLLVEMQDHWIPMQGRNALKVHAPHLNGHAYRPQLPSGKEIKRWSIDLLANDKALNWLHRKRGVESATAQRARIGYEGGVFRLPVFDEQRRVVNVRSYDPSPRADRRKIWSVKGCGSPPQLYPVGMFERAQPGNAILFCEGEWDALLAIQHGLLAVTRTAAARSLWHAEWTDKFADLDVYVCHDADVPGQLGNEIVADAVEPVARSVHVCELPYPVHKKHGKDVSDLIMEHGPDALRHVLDTAEVR